jgi:hypothetical protein
MIIICRLVTRLGNLSVILSKYHRKKIPRGRRVLYAQKIEEEETAEGESLKIREQFQIRQIFMKKSCRRQEHLKNSKKFVQIHERFLQKVESFKGFQEISQIPQRLL